MPISYFVRRHMRARACARCDFEMLDGDEISTSTLGMDAHGRAGRFNKCNLVSQ